MVPTPAAAARHAQLATASISLYIDGIEFEAVEEGNIAGFQATSQSFNIAGEMEQVLAFFGNPSPDAIQSSITFNERFAGPFGPFAVMAGLEALENVIQQQSGPS